MKFYLLFCSLLVLVSCSNVHDIRGKFVSEDKVIISIDCDFIITTNEEINIDSYPNNGDTIKLITNDISQNQISLLYNDNGIWSPFATWERSKDIINLGENNFKRLEIIE